MKNRKIITILTYLIVIGSIVATLTGILSKGGPGKYAYESIRGEDVMIYGKGLYKDMSVDVAVQGIAQDWITLLLGISVFPFSLYFTRKNSLKAKLLLSGTLGYFFVTYLFYTVMGMYNSMFLAYVFLMGASFFAFVLNTFFTDMEKIKTIIFPEKLLKNAGIFLIINSIMIALLWLSVVIPPLLDGTVIPKAVEHYTTLIVQGLDLGLLLPMAFVVGFLAIKKNFYGQYLTAIYVIFLSFLMTALTSKILFMANAGQNVIPVIFIIPTIGLIAIGFSISIIKSIKILKV